MAKFAKDTGHRNHDDTHPIYKRRKNRTTPMVAGEPVDVLGMAMPLALEDSSRQIWADLWRKAEAYGKLMTENRRLKMKLAAKQRTIVRLQTRVRKLQCRLG